MMRTTECTECSTMLPSDGIATHLEEFHVGPRLFEHVTISCESCNFRTTAERLNLMIKHCAMSGHSPEDVSADWRAFVSWELERIREIIVRGVEIFRPWSHSSSILRPRESESPHSRFANALLPERRTDIKTQKRKSRERKKPRKEEQSQVETDQTEIIQGHGSVPGRSGNKISRKRGYEIFNPEDCEDSKSGIVLLPHSYEKKRDSPLGISAEHSEPSDTEEESFTIPKRKRGRPRSTNPKVKVDRSAKKRKVAEPRVVEGPRRPRGRPRKPVAGDLTTLVSNLMSREKTMHASVLDLGSDGSKNLSVIDASNCGTVTSTSTSNLTGIFMDSPSSVQPITLPDRNFEENLGSEPSRDAILSCRMTLEDINELFSDPTRSLAWLCKHKLLADKVYCPMFIEKENRVCGEPMVLNKCKRKGSRLQNMVADQWNISKSRISKGNIEDDSGLNLTLDLSAIEANQVNQTSEVEAGEQVPKTKDRDDLDATIENLSQERSGQESRAMESIEDGFVWKCLACRRASSQRQPKKKSIKTNSFFSGTHYSIGFFIRTIWCWAELPNASLRQVLTHVGITRDLTIVFVYNRLRDLCADWCERNAPPQRLGGEGVVVEVDRSHLNRANNFGRVQSKAPGEWRIGMVERGTERMTYLHLHDTSLDCLLQIFKQWVEPGTILVSDFWDAYGETQRLSEKARDLQLSLQFLLPRDPRLAGSDPETAKWESVKHDLINGSITPRVKQPRYLFEYLFRRACKNENMFARTLHFISQRYPVDENPSTKGQDYNLGIEADS